MTDNLISTTIIISVTPHLERRKLHQDRAVFFSPFSLPADFGPVLGPGGRVAYVFDARTIELFPDEPPEVGISRAWNEWAGPTLLLARFPVVRIPCDVKASRALLSLLAVDFEPWHLPWLVSCQCEGHAERLRFADQVGLKVQRWHFALDCRAAEETMADFLSNFLGS